MTFDLATLANAYTDLLLRVGAPVGGIDVFENGLTLLLVGVCLGIALLPRGRGNGAVFCGVVLAALFLVRLPVLVLPAVNPDEASMLAGANRLLYDPVYWRSVDGNTTGPLCYYALLPFHLAGLPLNFATARMTSVLMLWATIAFLYRTARYLLPDQLARLGVMPMVAAALQYRSEELVRYVSECLPVCMTALALWLLARCHFAEPARARDWFLPGAVLALLPLAKLQAAPIAAILALAAAAETRETRDSILNSRFPAAPERWHRLAWLAAGASSVALGLIVYLARFGLMRDFYESYLVNNWSYANAGNPMWTPAAFARFVMNVPESRRYVPGILLFVALAVAHRLWKRAWRIPPPWTVAAGLLAASVYAAYRPGRGFPHYLLLLFLPLNLCAIAALASEFRECSRPRRLEALFLALTVLAPVVIGGFFHNHEFVAQLADRSRLEPSPAAARLSELAKPGDLVAIWGWAADLFVRTGTIEAARDPHTQRQIDDGPQRPYYVRRFLDDLRNNPPRVFLDAVGPSRFIYRDRRAFGHESLPEVREYVDQRFELVDDIDSVRFFVPRRAPVRPPGPALKTPLAIHAGGATIDNNGKDWQPDAWYHGGLPFRFPRAGVPANLSPLYLAERLCTRSCEYALPLAGGAYRIRLHFIELVYDKPGARVFDVTVNHSVALRDLDIFQEAGARGQPVVKEITAQVTDGWLTIGLLPKLREAKINAIEILTADSPGAR